MLLPVLSFGLYVFYLLHPIGWSVAYFVAGAFVWTCAITLSRENLLDGILRAMMFSIPLSFVSVLGTPYSDLPLSWFDVLSVVLFVYLLSSVVKSRTIFINEVVIAGLMFCLQTLPALMVSRDYASALKQYLHIVRFSLFLVAGTHLGATHRIDTARIKRWINDYVMAVRLTAWGLLCQVMIAKWFDVSYGTVMRMGGGRVAWGFLFSDFSFLSLYLATGSAILLARWFVHLRQRWALFLFDLAAHVVAMIVSSARTGAFALALITIFWALRNDLVRGIRWGKLLSNMVLVGGLCLVFIYGLTIVRPQDTWADSGRYMSYSVALKYFWESPVVGIGLGVPYAARLTGVGIPHNLFIQYLLQGGLLATIPLIFVIFALVRRMYVVRQELVAPLLTSLVGGMVIPDLINSRFFGVMSLLVVLDGCEDRVKVRGTSETNEGCSFVA